MVWAKAWPFLLVAGFIVTPSFAQDSSVQDATESGNQNSHEVDIELLEFMADWVSDEGEWTGPESFDSKQASVEESYEN